MALTVSYGRQDDYSEYTLLLNLNTQEVTDIFDGCGVDQLSGITNTVFSSDMSKALITCDNGASVYYCDMNTKTLLSVSEFTGTPVSAAWFLDDNKFAVTQLMRMANAHVGIFLPPPMIVLSFSRTCRYTGRHPGTA